MRIKTYDNNLWPFFDSSERGFEAFRLGDLFTERQKQAFPTCDFHEDKDHYFLSFDLPGLKKENLKINYENKVLTVSGVREEEHNTKEKQHSVIEKFYGSFKRSLELESDVDPDQISARFEQGVLNISLAKSVKSKGKEILITEEKKEGGFTKLLKNKKTTSN